MRSVLTLFFLLLLAGCTALTPAPTRTEKAPLANAPLSIRGNAVVEFTSGTVMRGHAVIITREPALFKIALLGPFGHTAWAMTGNEKSISIYENAKSTTYGFGDPKLPYSFTSRELIAYLTGNTPSTPAGWPGAESYRTIKNENGQITTVLKSIGGKPVLNVVMGNYRTVSGHNLPFLISISDTHRNLKIRFNNIEVNPPINEAIFGKNDASTPGLD